jgi:hypothetical protein
MPRASKIGVGSSQSRTFSARAGTSVSTYCRHFSYTSRVSTTNSSTSGERRSRTTRNVRSPSSWSTEGADAEA